MNSIIETWGEQDHPFSFCYLGDANYKYNELIKILEDKKRIEKKRFEEKGCTYYNAISKNCQHFACDIEKILFGKIIYHSFEYYLDQFYEKFFHNVDIMKLKTKYELDLKKKNEELFKENIKIITNSINSRENNEMIRFGFVKTKEKKKLKSYFLLKLMII